MYLLPFSTKRSIDTIDIRMSTSIVVGECSYSLGWTNKIIYALILYVNLSRSTLLLYLFLF